MPRARARPHGRSTPSAPASSSRSMSRPGVTVGAHQVACLPPRRHGRRRGPRRPGGTDARPGPDRGPGRRCDAEHEREVADFWERSEVVWEGAPRRAAGPPLQPVHDPAGVAAQRGARRAGQGPDGHGLRRPLLLGHRGLRAAVPDPHLARGRPQPAHAPGADAARAPAVGPARWAAPAHCSRGAPSTARKPRPTTPPAPRSTTSTRTSPTPSTSTSRVTGDTDFLFRHGVELLVETARMWAGLGFFSERHGGRFVIHKVTGPDEYSTVVDNNLFTNLMAAENLRHGGRRGGDRMRAGVTVGLPRDWSIASGCSEDEEASWRRAAAADLRPVRRRRPASTSRTTASSTRSPGTSPAHRRTGIHCCCTTTRSSSTATRSSSRPTSCWRPSCCRSGSPPRSAAGSSSTTTR